MSARHLWKALSLVIFKCYSLVSIAYWAILSTSRARPLDVAVFTL